MSKRTTILLIWSSGKYEAPNSPVSLPAQLENQPWFAWLDTLPSFSFQSRWGHCCTVRREQMRGGTYWYGYRRQAGKLKKRYLGRTADLTLARLEEIAAQLDDASSPPPPPFSEEKGKPSISTHFDAQTGTNEVHTSHLISPSELGERSSHLLLASKFHVPRLPRRLVERLHLVGLLFEGQQRKLTLISAPAGSGKTTLLTQWLSEGGMPFAWLSLDESDNDPIRFFSYVIAALRKSDAHLGASALALLSTPGFSQLETALTVFMNDLVNNLREDVALILDDYHVIESQFVHQGMSFLLEHLPPRLHLVIATREDPPFAFPLLRVRRQLMEIGTAELRFDTAEIELFLREVMGLHFNPGELALLQNRTEGWIAGLQLAALSMQGHSDAARVAASGSHQYIADYLLEEVFGQQEAHIQAFLLRTCILDRMTGHLCDALVLDSRAPGQATLEHLERANLFIVPLDNERRWYRYHHLFADFLRHQLEKGHADIIPMLYQRASWWCEQNNHLSEAIDYALAASNVEDAARLIAEIGGQYEFNGEATMLSHWLSQLPDDLIRSHSRLCLLRCWSLLMKSQLPAAERWLHQAKEILFSEEKRSKRDGEVPSLDQTSASEELVGSFFMLSAYLAIVQGDVLHCVESASQALALLPEHQTYTRSFVTLHKGFAYALMGDLSGAAKTYTQAARLGQMIDNSYVTITALCSLATMQGKWGQFRAAEQTYQQALRLSSRNVEPYPFASMAHIGLAAVLYEWNDLSTARQHLLEGVALSEQWGNTDYLIYGSIILAALHQVQGREDEAIVLMDKVNHYLTTCQLPIWGASMVATYQTRLLLMQGDTQGAVHWASTHHLGDYEHPTQARILLAQRQYQRALETIEQHLPIVEVAGLSFEVIEFLMLRAIAYYQCSEIAGSILALERALSLAQIEGYTRLFVDAGEPMAALLFKVERQQQRRNGSSFFISPTYIRKLLGALEVDVHSFPLEKSSLTLPHASSLSKREIEIIHCIVDGMSNEQIAQHFVIAKSTVSWHLKNIYSKLGVQTRAQLLLKAREGGL